MGKEPVLVEFRNDDMRRIEAAAERNGISVMDFVRVAALEKTAMDQIHAERKEEADSWFADNWRLPPPVDWREVVRG